MYIYGALALTTCVRPLTFLQMAYAVWLCIHWEMQGIKQCPSKPNSPFSLSLCGVQFFAAPVFSFFSVLIRASPAPIPWFWLFCRRI